MPIVGTLPQIRMAAQTQLDQGNLALAELISWDAIDKERADPASWNILGKVAMKLGRHACAIRRFSTALEINPGFRPSKKYLAEAQGALAAQKDAPAPTRPRYLVIREWGCGFWSEVDFLLGHLLLAEITGRIPIVSWGAGCLFGDHSDRDCFTDYFEPVSPHTLGDVCGKGLAFFPPKWNDANLPGRVPNRWQGPGSRSASIYVLGSDAQVAVCDYFFGLSWALDWVEPEHPLFGKSLEEAYRWLLAKYVRPRADILREADAFVSERMPRGPRLAVHLRASDKYTEDSNLNDYHKQYPAEIKRIDESEPFASMFFMTCSENTIGPYRRAFGDRLVVTPSLRSTSPVGAHFSHENQGPRLGREVLLDTLIALRCDRFIGQGPSNVSAMISVLKPWSPDRITLLGKRFGIGRGLDVFVCETPDYQG